MIKGVPTRSVDDLVQGRWGCRASPRTRSRGCAVRSTTGFRASSTGRSRVTAPISVCFVGISHAFVVAVVAHGHYCVVELFSVDSPGARTCDRRDVACGAVGEVVWRQIAYFGDAIAHAAILGVAVSLAFSISTVIGVLIVAVSMAIAVSTLSGRGLAMDTLLGVLALVVWRWSALLTATLSPELAHGGGINPNREQLAMTITLAVLVAVSIEVVGALLITAMLIVPAAAARPFSNTPERMAVGAALIGVASVLAGLAHPGTGTRRLAPPS